jgi:hypothetical protein
MNSQIEKSNGLKLAMHIRRLQFQVRALGIVLVTVVCLGAAQFDQGLVYKVDQLWKAISVTDDGDEKSVQLNCDRLTITRDKDEKNGLTGCVVTLTPNQLEFVAQRQEEKRQIVLGMGESLDRLYIGPQEQERKTGDLSVEVQVGGTRQAPKAAEIKISKHEIGDGPMMSRSTENGNDKLSSVIGSVIGTSLKKKQGEKYKAETDGFVHTFSGGTQANTWHIYVNGAHWARAYNQPYSCLLLPVRAGEEWEVRSEGGNVNVYWFPIN